MECCFDMKRIISILLACFLFSFEGICCTSVIISGKATRDGRPLMLKHRDTGELNNRLQWFQGEKYSFVGLVNSSWEKERVAKHPFARGEVWTGTNSAGFSIMNTATYDLKDDKVADEFMDREGELMYRALEICKDVSDFEVLLDTLSRPMGVEANFGVIDAYGGACYYEVNNHKWTKFDVNEEEKGYRVVTNFTMTGRPKQRKGVDRYNRASKLMNEVPKMSYRTDSQRVYLVKDIYSHKGLFNVISRSGSPILRDITACSIVIEGVKSGENPLHTVMWTCLGLPTCIPYIPVLVLDSDHIPFYLKKGESGDNAEFCDLALSEKAKRGLEPRTEGFEVEKFIDEKFDVIIENWREGKIDTDQFGSFYDTFIRMAYKQYVSTGR